jgi:hypothetical protein
MKLGLMVLIFLSFSDFGLAISKPFLSKLLETSDSPCRVSNDFGEPCTTELEFENLIENIVLEFSPDFRSVGWTLSSTSDWSNDQENATYDFISSNEVAIKIYGGLARATNMTLDGLALVACHEIGHFYGFITNTGNPAIWGAEGEADYFSISNCLHRVLRHVSSRSDFLLPSSVTDHCSDQGGDAERCLRACRAAFSVSTWRSRILAQGTVSFLTPDPTIVNETTFELTSAQCGLDTFYLAARAQARPRCWFRE